MLQSTHSMSHNEDDAIAVLRFSKPKTGHTTGKEEAQDLLASRAHWSTAHWAERPTDRDFGERKADSATDPLSGCGSPRAESPF